METVENETQDIRVITPKEQKLVSSAEAQLAIARTYKVTSAVLYGSAADDLKTIKGHIDALESERKSITGPLDIAKKRVMDLFRRPLAILEEAEQCIKRAMLTYNQERERLRQEEERRLREQQEKQQRVAQESAERAKREAEAAAALSASAETEEERAAAQSLLVEADALAENARTEAAALAVAPTPVVAPQTQKVVGISTRATWKGECYDKLALIKAVAAGSAPITLLDINVTVLNQMARAMKETMSYPGCRSVKEEGIASSRR